MEEHYFTADPATPFKRVPVRANVWGHWLELTSGSGVFAQGRLDIGTGVLLREAGAAGGGARGPRPRLRLRRDRPGDRGRCAARRGSRPSTSTSGRCCSPGRTPSGWGWPTGSARVLPDEVDPGATYDEIWSNPPIRVGKEALHELLLQRGCPGCAPRAER